MDKNTLFRKSAKGLEAFASRQSGLAPKLRSLLILVDGKRPVSDLVKMAVAGGDALALLDQLEAEGYIESDSRPKPSFEASTVPQSLMPASGPEPAGVPVDPASVPAVAVASPVPAKAPAAPVTLVQAKQLAARLVTSALGPVGEEVCMRIEASRSLADYTSAVKRAYAVIREVRGGAAAAQFGAQIEANLPPA